LDKIIKAYAKINLHLEVLNKRLDGYHNIFSLMASVNLYDLLKLEKFDVNISASHSLDVEINSISGKYSEFAALIPVDDNLITKAARQYAAGSGFSGTVSFSLEKNIPAGAGLGGGSSDAAAAIRLLNNNSVHLDEDELCLFAQKTGADVPYCLNGGFAICEGTGEVIEQCPGGFDEKILIVNNGVHVSTPEAYASLARPVTYEPELQYVSDVKSEIRKALKLRDFSIINNVLKNDFEFPVFEKFPSVKKLKDDVYGSGADFAIMTGSGSTVIGIFSDSVNAENAKKYFCSRGNHTVLTKFV